MELWTTQRLREEFITFFKKNNHRIFPSSSLTNSGDSTVLLTTAGMQQFKSYYLSPKKADADFGSRNAASAQKCFRTTDIDEVGDDTHNTFFEMLGNFSFGGYFKKEAIAFAHKFITGGLNLPISYVTVFQGSDLVPKDKESVSIWNALGIKDVREEGIDDVFWGPTGNEGPCGPTTEIYCKNAKGQDVEIWNIVFNEYFCSGSRETLLAGQSTLDNLETKGIDTGMGLERLSMIAQRVNSIFDIDITSPLITLINGYNQANLPEELMVKSQRIVADHMRGATFLMAEGLAPSNVKAGYILRRILRRAIRYAYQLKLPYESFHELSRLTSKLYQDAYPELSKNMRSISSIFEKEYQIFGKAIKKGTEEFNASARRMQGKSFPGKDAFYLFSTFGFPLELIEEMAQERGLNVAQNEFKQELEAHRQKSKA